jgi:hypothetical protein
MRKSGGFHQDWDPKGKGIVWLEAEIEEAWIQRRLHGEEEKQQARSSI